MISNILAGLSIFLTVAWCILGAVFIGEVMPMVYKPKNMWKVVLVALLCGPAAWFFVICYGFVCGIAKCLNIITKKVKEWMAK